MHKPLARLCILPGKFGLLTAVRDMRYSGEVRINREPSKLNSMNYFFSLFTRANVKHYVAFQILDVNLSTSTYKNYPSNVDPLSLQLSVLRRSDDELYSIWVNTQIGQLPAVNSYALIEKSLRGWRK